MRQRGLNGQSTVEYILVLAAIVVAVIAAASTVVKPAVEEMITDAKSTLTTATAKLDPD